MRRHTITAGLARHGVRRARAGLVLAVSVCLTSPALAETTVGLPRNEHHAPIRAALARYADAGVQTRTQVPRASLSQSSSPSPGRRSFAARHPVWTGVLVGGSAGTALAAGVWGNEGAFVGLYTGAAAGALVGWLVSR